ncbi:hypothetical protein HZC31_04100 [Candidatus Woesearchaeota archaeon]|nr:hypothetical protein [Candidatus Woesearchaeota archaeon]
MVKKVEKRSMKKNTKKPKNKLKLRQRIKIKAREVPALLRAKKEEKKHIPTFEELRNETKEFEKEALSLSKIILRKPKKRK